MRTPPFASFLAVLPLTLLACGSGDGGGGGSLNPVSIGDTTISASANGSFDVTVNGKKLLSAQPSPLSILDFKPSASLLFGQFDYQTGDVKEARPGKATSLALDGAAAALKLEGDGATATLHFARTADEVTITVDASAPALQPWAMAMRFACDPAARFLGFGEQYEKLDHKGEAFPLWTSEQGIGRDPNHPSPLSGNPWTTYYPVPFFLDPRGFGFAADTSARVTVDLCSTDPSTWSITIDEGKQLTLHLYTGPTVKDVIRAFSVLDGRSSYPPDWAISGVWIGAQGGPTRVGMAVQTALDNNIPITAIWVQDWLGKLDLGGGTLEIKYHWTLDDTLYPNFANWITGLHGKGIHFLGYFNPFLVPMFGTEFDTAAKMGYAVKDASGKPWQGNLTVFPGGHLNLTNPDAVTWFQGFAKQALADGQDGWMDDFGEWLPYDGVLFKGDAPHEHNLYPTRWHKAARDVMGPDTVNFTRSGWLGEAKVAQVVWAGDQQADWDPWDGLPTVVPALISLGLVGIAYSTHDICGFSGGPSTKELYMRWTELGAFSPVMRTHEGLNSGVNWYWYSDADTLAHFARFTRIHKALAPTFRALEQEHKDTGMPLIRALVLTWPDDAQAVPIADEYTIGTDLLVTPVVTQGATTRQVYFPKGHWVDVWDPTKSYDGPASIMVNAPIGKPPVFSQSGRTDLKDIQ